MTDRAQFEAMLEALINENQEEAKEIFHNIVVAKAREIYEELLAEDFGAEEEGEEEEEEGEEEEESGEEEYVQNMIRAPRMPENLRNSIENMQVL